MQIRNIDLSAWMGMSAKAQSDLKSGSSAVNILTANGKVVFHLGNGQQGNGPWPRQPDINDVLVGQQAVMAELQRKRNAPLPPMSGTAAAMLGQVQDFVKAAEAMGFQGRNSAGISEGEFEEAVRVLTNAQAGHTATLASIESRVRELDETAKAILRSAEAQRNVGVTLDGFVAECKETLSADELGAVVNELRGARIAKMTGWQYAWHLCLNYVLPMVALVAAATVGIIAGAGVGFLAGRWTAPAAEIGVDASYDASVDGIAGGDVVGMNGQAVYN
jgi:hypothetical protein